MDDIIDFHTADVITSYLLMSPCLIIFAPLKAAVHGVVTGADAFVLQPASLWPYIRRFYGRLKHTKKLICIIILLISAHALPWFITPWEEQMTSGDIPCSQSERFNSVEQTITSYLVELEVGWEGRVGWQWQEWLVLKHTVWVLNFMHLSFTNVKQRKLNFRI